MLALSPELQYIHEPFAPMYERAWLTTPPEHRFYHEPPSERGRYAEDLGRIVNLQPPWISIARRAGGLRNAVRIAQEAAVVSRARARGARALIKDPFALLLAEWIEARSGAQIVVLVRHPAAFASSVMRLGWRLDVASLLEQSDLMSSELAEFRDELEADREGQTDLLENAALVWRALNTVVLRYSRDHPDWTCLRYEDLAAEPVDGFRTLYDTLGVSWDAKISSEIIKRNAPSNPSEVATDSKGGTRRFSRAAMWTWRDRLTPEEIERIRVATLDVAQNWYDDRDWEPPPASS